MSSPKIFGGIPEKFTKYDKAKIVLLPVPFDGTSTWQKGADKGFDAFIEASENMELYDIETESEVYKNGIFIQKAIRKGLGIIGCHDISDGGICLALAEMCISNNMGV